MFVFQTSLVTRCGYVIQFQMVRRKNNLPDYIWEGFFSWLKKTGSLGQVFGPYLILLAGDAAEKGVMFGGNKS